METPQGWTYHQKGYRQPPQQIHGRGSSYVETEPDDNGFEVDDKTGLLIPEGAAKERRKVIGFQPDSRTT